MLGMKVFRPYVPLGTKRKGEGDECISFQLAKVIKQLRASHRLILSGTPIQVRFLKEHFSIIA